MYLEEVRRVPRQSSVRPRRTKKKKQGKVNRNDHTSHAPLVGESKVYFLKNSASYHTRTEPRTEQLTTQFSHGQPLAPKPSLSSVTKTRDTLLREVMVIHIDTVALRTKGQRSVCVFKHFEEGQSQTKCKNQPRMDLIYSVTSSSPPQRRIKWSGIVMDIIIEERRREEDGWIGTEMCTTYCQLTTSHGETKRPFSEPYLSAVTLNPIAFAAVARRAYHIALQRTGA